MRTQNINRQGIKEVLTFHDNAWNLTQVQYIPYQDGMYKSRSEIVHNPEVQRWRRPSAYVFELHDWSGWRGNYEVQWYPSQYLYAYRGALEDSFARFNNAWPRYDIPPHGGSMWNQAVITALNKAKDQKVNLGVSFAEARRTVDTVSSRVTKVLTAYLHVKKGRWQHGARALGYRVPFKSRKALSDREKARRKLSRKDPAYEKSTGQDWLELQYGWTPLVNDVYNLAEEFDRQTVVNPFRFTVDCKASDLDSHTIDCGVYAASQVYFSDLRKPFVGISLTYTVKDAATMMSNRFGLLNPAPIAWELLPGSFIWDWFMPVGNWLSALDAAVGLEFVGGSSTRGVRGTYAGWLEPAGNAHYVFDSDTKCSGSYFYFSRGAFLNSPIPLPYIRNPLSTTRVVNAAALIRSRRK